MTLISETGQILNNFVKKTPKLSSLDMIKLNYESNSRTATDWNSLHNVLGRQASAPVSANSNATLPIKRSWMEHECLKYSKTTTLGSEENLFFQSLIKKHLYPLKVDKNQAQKVDELRKLRNNSFFAIFMLNAGWIGFIFTLNLLRYKFENKIYLKFSVAFEEPSSYEPVSFIYVVLFMAVLLMQFAAMLFHRAIVFMQMIRKTSLRGVKPTKSEVEKKKRLMSRRGRITPYEAGLQDLHEP